jgi:hypothetical protein
VPGHGQCAREEPHGHRPAVLQGIPGLNAFPGEASKNPTDTIKINLGTPPSSDPERLGVLARTTPATRTAAD